MRTCRVVGATIVDSCVWYAEAEIERRTAYAATVRSLLFAVSRPNRRYLISLPPLVSCREEPHNPQRSGTDSPAIMYYLSGWSESARCVTFQMVSTE